jgi:hypothetical protein
LRPLLQGCVQKLAEARLGVLYLPFRHKVYNMTSYLTSQSKWPVQPITMPGANETL